MIRLHTLLSVVLCLGTTGVAITNAQDAAAPRDTTRLRRPMATAPIQAAVQPDPSAQRTPGA